jgi:DNA-binding CsgD family transcriptional regulator
MVNALNQRRVDMGVGDIHAERAARGFMAPDEYGTETPAPAARCIAGCGLGTEPENSASDVRLYGLADLIQESDASQRPATGLLRQLLNAASGRDRERVIRRRLDDIGFEWLAYYTLSHAPGGAPRRACLATFAHAEWTRRYFEQSYHEVDPRQEQIRQSSLPLVWDIDWVEDALGGRAQTPRVHCFTQDFRGSGMGSGVLVRVPTDSQSPIEHAVISLGSSGSTRRWIDDRVLGEALVIGLSLHDYVSHHVQFRDAAQEQANVCCLHASSLPPRQQAVLRHVAHGLTDRAIAEKLGVSLHTVDYYLRQLRQHFAVHNRVQLLAAAAHLLGQERQERASGRRPWGTDSRSLHGR